MRTSDFVMALPFCLFFCLCVIFWTFILPLYLVYVFIKKDGQIHTILSYGPLIYFIWLCINSYKASNFIHKIKVLIYTM